MLSGILPYSSGERVSLVEGSADSLVADFEATSPVNSPLQPLSRIISKQDITKRMRIVQE